MSTIQSCISSIQSQSQSQHNNNNIPPEIFIEIINNVRLDSTQFLIDYLNILNAIDPIHNKPLLNYLIDNTRNHIDFIDFNSFISQESIPPFVQNLLKYFNCWKQTVTQKNDKFILLIDDTLLNQFKDYTSFKDGFLDKVFGFNFYDYCKINYDIIYIPSISECPNTKVTDGYMHCKPQNSNLMKFISFLPQNFILDNLIIDFNHNKILLPKDLFGIYTSQFFIFHDDLDIVEHNNNSSKWLQPRCNQITFPTVTHFLIDYMAMDTFISNILENHGLISYSTHHFNSNNANSISPVQYLFNLFLNNVSFHSPQLIDLKFNNKNCPNATCNFIDLSTNILTQLSINYCSLKSYFEMHSLPNWHINKLETFGGHRFKFDVTTNSQSTEDSNKKIVSNIKLLATMINNQTKDGVTYLRVHLFPPTTKTSKLLNWLPLGSSETLQETSETGRTVSPTREIIPQDAKPILCLNSSSLLNLELRVLAIDLYKNNHIQGLFLPNLQKLTLQNFQFDVNSPYKVTSNWDSNNNSNNNQNNQNDNDDKTMVDELNLYPTGFSSWNALQNCELITLIDNIQQSDQRKSHSIHLIFNIRNLKQTMPKIKLKESFYTFVDERQQFIVV